MKKDPYSSSEACRSWGAFLQRTRSLVQSADGGHEMLQSGKHLKGVIINNKISNVRPKGGGVKESRKYRHVLEAAPEQSENNCDSEEKLAAFAQLYWCH